VAYDARHLCVNVCPDGRCDVKMVTSNVQIHCVLSIKGIERSANTYNGSTCGGLVRRSFN
jgi:hypothetical protein